MRLDEFIQNQSNENPYENMRDAEFKKLPPQVSLFDMLVIKGQETKPLTGREEQYLEECERRGVTLFSGLDCEPA